MKSIVEKSDKDKKDNKYKFAKNRKKSQIGKEYKVCTRYMRYTFHHILLNICMYINIYVYICF